MPLPTDEHLLSLSADILKQFETLFGSHPGFRPAHAKGALLEGTFTPAAGAGYLTTAPHIERESTPVTVRFSNGTGLPQIPDNNPNAAPHGMAVRFNLAEHVHTDIIAHSTDGFPVRTGEEFLEFLSAVAASDPSKPHPSPVEVFLGSHPKALAYVQTPKPAPSSFARESYFGVTAMRFTNKDGLTHFGRYRIVPEAGVKQLSDSEAASRGADYLFDELPIRIASGPIAFQVLVQLANGEDVVDDATAHWPEDRTLFDFGRIVLTSLVSNDAAAQKQIIFDPIPRVEGIDPSEDPLLELRAAVYLISGRKRRSA
jgi:catalase